MRGTARVRAYPPCVVILVSLVKLINIPCHRDTAAIWCAIVIARAIDALGTDGRCRGSRSSKIGEPTTTVNVRPQ